MQNLIQESIFTIMTREAQKCGAINLAQGFPDMPVEAWILEQLSKAMLEGPHQYAPVQGLEALRKAFQLLYQQKFSIDDPLEEITITSGATHGIYTILRTFLQKGDHVIFMAPFYDSYLGSAQLNHARIIEYTLNPPNFEIEEESLRALIEINPIKTKMIALNNPHNPSGRVFSRKELDIVARLAKEYNLLVLADEVYEFLVYPPFQHIPFRSLPEMRERTLTTVSMGKTYGITGMKIGAIIAPTGLTKKLLEHLQFIIFSTSSLLQSASARIILESLQNGHFENLQKTYELKRNYLYAKLYELGLRPYLPQGSYFILANYEGVSSLPDKEFALTLTHQASVASIPPSVFYLNGSKHKLLRFCFAKELSTLEKAAQLLKKYFVDN